MPRPSQGLDRALVASGRALFADLGCAGLSVRAVAEHAGVTPAMLHYHFGSKEAFLRTLLQQLYEEMFEALSGRLAEGGTPQVQLRAALLTLAGFAREHRRELGRLWADAVAGEAVAVEFFSRNLPRHMGLLQKLLGDAGATSLPVPQALALVLGSVVLPLVFVAGLVHAGAVPGWRPERFDTEVASDAAIAARIDLVLAALGLGSRGHGAPARSRAPRAGAAR